MINVRYIISSPTRFCPIAGFCYGIASAIGVTGGAHRLWAHGAYKAKWPLRVILITLQTAAFQNSVWEWVRDHRVHHKYTDTDADPHNFRRGFFFAHMGWLLVRKHPLVKEKGARIDLSDIESDPICMFQKRYFLLLMPVLAFGLPTYINMAVFQMPFGTALHCTNLRYMLSLHVAWLVNSAAHCWGHRPFDSTIQPVNNRLLAYMILGEGWHNYHHVFPWDYKTAEYGTYFLNATTAVIDFFALFGWAYDLKVVARPMLMQRAMRTGDGTFRSWKQDSATVGVKDNLVGEETATDSEMSNRIDQGVMLWGWEDTDLPEQAKKYVNILNTVE